MFYPKTVNREIATKNQEVVIVDSNSTTKTEKFIKISKAFGKGVGKLWSILIWFSGALGWFYRHYKSYGMTPLLRRTISAIVAISIFILYFRLENLELFMPYFIGALSFYLLFSKSLKLEGYIWLPILSLAITAVASFAIPLYNATGSHNPMSWSDAMELKEVGLLIGTVFNFYGFFKFGKRK